MSLALRHLLMLLISVQVAAGALVNITVDDSGLNQLTGLGFSYSPTDDWNFGPDCTKCSAQLDRSQLSMGTWHDATYDGPQGVQSATLDFNGSAIYVFGVIVTSPLIPLSFTSSTSLSFLIDDESVGTFNSTPVGDGSQPTAFQYNTLLYSNNSIPPGPHTFVLQNGLNGGPDSIVLFDYLIYSTDLDNTTSNSLPSSTSLLSSPSPPPSTSSTSPPPPVTPTSSSSSAPAISTVHSSSSSVTLAKILPATLIPALLILVAIILTVLWIRRRGRARGSHVSEVDPFGLPEVSLNAHDNFAAERMPYDDAPPPSEPYPHLLQPMQSAGPSSFSMSREQFSSEKSRARAFSQEHLSRNPSLRWRSGLAETEYPETVPPPYASEFGEAV